MLSPEQIISLLDLKPHPQEGGYFAETYRSAHKAPDGHRALATAIYYMLRRGQVSAMHRLASDEIFHFYAGDPVEMLLLFAQGASRRVTLGSDLEAGQRPQVMVPAGAWQGSALAGNGTFALLGTTVSPGFDPRDFELGDIEALARDWPTVADAIRARALKR
jgi:predicted cupin superfamily sugar epimerase